MWFQWTLRHLQLWQLPEFDVNRKHSFAATFWRKPAVLFFFKKLWFSCLLARLNQGFQLETSRRWCFVRFGLVFIEKLAHHLVGRSTTELDYRVHHIGPHFKALSGVRPQVACLPQVCNKCQHEEYVCSKKYVPCSLDVDDAVRPYMDLPEHKHSKICRKRGKQFAVLAFLSLQWKRPSF